MNLDFNLLLKIVVGIFSLHITFTIWWLLKHYRDTEIEFEERLESGEQTKTKPVDEEIVT